MTRRSESHVLPAPGMSRFRVKGHVWRGALDYYAMRVPGGGDALLRALPPALRGFCGQPFLAGALYDALPIAQVSDIAARLCGVERASILRDRARWQAMRDLRGIYRALLVFTSPRSVALRLGRMAIQYFDFGSVQASMTAPTTCEIVERGVPAPLAPCMAPIAEGWATLALSWAGAYGAELQADPPLLEGRQQGMEIYVIRIRLSWI